MGGRDKEIPLAPIDRLIHKVGAERVSEEASQALRDILEKLGEEIAKEAVELAKHAGRKTVTRGDIEYAAKRITRAYVMMG